MALGSLWPAQAAEPLPGGSLASLLAAARKNNPELASARAEAEAAGERVQPAGALPDPVLRIELENVTNGGATGASLAPSRVGDTKYTLMQSLPFWGKRELRRDAAEAEAGQARHRTDGIWRELAAQLKSAYAGWWLNGRLAAVNRELGDLTARLERIARARYEGGLAPQQDAIRAQVERTALLSEGIELEHERHRLAAQLNGLLARPAAAPLAAAGELPPMPDAAQLAGLTGSLSRRNPSLAAEEARIVEAKARRDLAYRERYPDFTLGLVPMQVGNAVPSWSLMLEMNLPLQQESRRSREREAERMLEAAEARKAALGNRLAGELETEVAGFEMARDTESLVQGVLLPQADLGFQSALAGYEAGKVDFATLMEAQKLLRQARQNLYKAQAGRLTSLANIERLAGERP